MDQVSPILELVLGTVPVLATLFIHGIGMYFIEWRFADRRPDVRTTRLGAELFFGGMIVVMLMTHLIEIIVWAATLALLGAAPVFRDAFYFVAGTYTTLGYGKGGTAAADLQCKLAVIDRTCCPTCRLDGNTS